MDYLGTARAALSYVDLTFLLLKYGNVRKRAAPFFLAAECSILFGLLSETLSASILLVACHNPSQIDVTLRVDTLKKKTDKLRTLSEAQDPPPSPYFGHSKVKK